MEDLQAEAPEIPDGELPEGPRITIREHGPYRVSGSPRLTRRRIVRSEQDESIAWEPEEGTTEADWVVEEETFVLCRCGQSQDKPFCDGSHKRLGFDGELTADRGPTAARRQAFPGPNAELTDDGVLCVHAEFCFNRRTDIWALTQQEEDADEATDEAERMVRRCPSGRLVFTRHGAEPSEPPYEPSIATVPNGPLWVRGRIAIEAPDGFTYEVRNRMTLCRCGNSSNKPFCDGSHSKIGFRAP
jgi:CDGSH-type Zn-finger protein